MAVIAVIAAGCGKSSDDSKGAGNSTARTLHVPKDYPTIQKAVDVAKPGDLVLIAAGTYNESATQGVTVETDNIVIRGEDRNSVILDGKFENENAIKVFSNGVAVENLTLRNNTKNGLFFTGDYGKGVTLKGYRASYVTAANNGDYGIYAFSAENGQIDHSYGSGNVDSAFYVGQCEKCNALLTELVSENNMLGYSGTNSTGVTIVNSTFRNNRAGIVPNSLYTEAFYPNKGTTIVGNVVSDNNNAEAPNNDGFAIAYGNGIVLAGTQNVVVERNLISGHKVTGVVIADLPESVDKADGKSKSFKPENNTVRDNTLSANTYDLVYLTINYASTPFGNCFEKNTFTTSFPADIETKMSCGGPDTDLGDLSAIVASIPPTPPDVDYKTVKAPPAQPNMPNATTAKAVPATNVPAKINLDSIKTPTAS